MRVKKFAIIVVIVFWIIVTILLFRSRTQNNIKVLDIQNRILTIEKQLDKQLADSSQVLNIVKEQLTKVKPKVLVADNENTLRDNRVVDLNNPVLPVLVIACDRLTVKRCLDNLINNRPNKETFPIIISQDCGHNETYNVIKDTIGDDRSITLVQQPDLSYIPLEKQMIKFQGYYKIARHFKFAINYVLVKLGYDAVIIVEDDLDISPDFFEYFLGTYPLLHKDKSIWCISAWNDNGKKDLIDIARPELLHRTDFFPGLGWMITRETWNDLEPRWPKAFFDDWLRNPDNVKGRACVRPEVSRTYSFGKVGVSRGLFFDMHLKYIQLNRLPVDFTKLNLTYLVKNIYDDYLQATVDAVPIMSAEEVVSMSREEDGHPVKVLYHSAKSYHTAAKILGLMEDFRSGVPRTAYRGIVTCFIRGHRVYLVPNYTWTKYDSSWS